MLPYAINVKRHIVSTRCVGTWRLFQGSWQCVQGLPELCAFCVAARWRHSFRLLGLACVCHGIGRGLFFGGEAHEDVGTVFSDDRYPLWACFRIDNRESAEYGPGTSQGAVCVAMRTVVGKMLTNWQEQVHCGWRSWPHDRHVVLASLPRRQSVHDFLVGMTRCGLIQVEFVFLQ